MNLIGFCLDFLTLVVLYLLLILQKMEAKFAAYPSAMGSCQDQVDQSQLFYPIFGSICILGNDYPKMDWKKD